MADVRVVARQRARLAASGPAHPTEIFCETILRLALPESMQGTEPNDGQNFPPLVAGRRYRWGPFVAMRGRRRQGSSPCHFTPPWVAEGSDAYARVANAKGYWEGVSWMFRSAAVMARQRQPLFARRI
jgi:hypothetical protein